MRKRKIGYPIFAALILLILIVVPVLAAYNTFPPDPTPGPALTLGFQGCSLNNYWNTFYGEAQLTVDVYPWWSVESEINEGDPGSADQVMFVVRNVGTENLVVSEVYVDDGVLLDLVEVYDSDDPNGEYLNEPLVENVDFTEDAADPPNLPAANCVDPAFGTLRLFTADADNPPPHNGIGPGEIFGLRFTLQPATSFADVVTGLNNGLIRVGLHVIGYDDGGSESFVTENATAITLESFSARNFEDHVTLYWQTGTEIDNAGFNLYRSDSPGGAKTLLTPSLLAPKGSEVSGASYTFGDSPGSGVFYYWLEDVDFSGVRTLHGPVRAHVRPFFVLPLHRPTVPGL